MLAGWLLFTHISSMWIAYGILLTFIVFIVEILDWRATISVNGVIAAHLVTYENFNDTAVWNELGIVLVGVGFAIVFNLFNGNYEHKRHIMRKNQCQILHNLHYEMKIMRTMPKNAKIAAAHYYFIYLWI